VSAGCGMKLDASAISVYELERIAAAAKGSGASLFVENYTKLSVNDRIKIGSAGNGHVTFI